VAAGISPGQAQGSWVRPSRPHCAGETPAPTTATPTEGSNVRELVSRLSTDDSRL